jgi:hypothetical protein
MRDWAGTTLVCVATTAAGWPWASYLTGQRPPPLARAALAWLVGAALVTLAMLIVVYPGLPLNRASLAVAFAGTFALGWALDRRSPRRRSTALVPGSMWAAAAPGAVALAALAYGSVLAFRLGPVDSTDFVNIWGIKGVFAFEDHSLAFSGHHGSHIFYPLLVSNLNAAVYIALGHVNDTVVRLPGALFGLAVAGAMWWLLRLRAPPAWAALAVCLAVTTPEFTITMTSGLADLTTAAYLTVALLAGYLWATSPGSDWAALSGFMAGGAAWTKLEGAPTAIVLFVAVVVIRGRVRVPGAATWLLWMAAFLIPWQVYMRIHDIPLSREHFAQLYLNVWWIIDHVTQTLLETSHWGLFWPVCVAIVALAAPIWWRSEWRALGILVIPNLILMAAAYVTQYGSGSSGSVEATAHRLYLHLAPAAAALAAVAAMTAWDRVAPRLKGMEVHCAGHDQPTRRGDNG